MESLKDRIRQLLSDGDTDEALEELDAGFREQKHRLHSDLVILNGEFSDITKGLKTNLISNEDAQRAKNRINDAILDLLDRMDEEEIESPIAANTTDSSVKSKLKLGMLLAVVGGIAVIVITLFIILSDKINGSSEGHNDASIEIPFSDANQDNKADDNADTDEKDENQNEASDFEIDDNETVMQLVVYELGLTIYDKYKNVYLHGQFSDPRDAQVFKKKKEDVRVKTKQLIDNLNLVKDDNIELHSKFYKYIGLLVSDKILALTTDDKAAKIDYTTKAFGHVNKLNDYLKEVNELPNSERAFQMDMLEWIQEEEHKSRIHLNNFICMAVNHQAGGEIKAGEIKNYHKKMTKEKNILKDKGYHIYPIIKWLFEEGIIEHKN